MWGARSGRRGPEGDTGGRAVSPVVGTALLLVIVVLAVVVAAQVFMKIGEEPDPSPDVVMDLEKGEFAPVHYLHHGGGDDLGGNGKTRIRGIANPDVLHDEELNAGDREEVIPVVPVDEEVQVVWRGDDGTSYVLWRFHPSSYLDRSVDEGCGWVAAETNDGSDPITVDGVVVNCDIITNGDIDVVNDAVIIGNATSLANNVDLDESVVYGPVNADGDVDLDGTNVSGSVDSDGSDVVLTDGSRVGGDVTIGSGGNVDIDGGSSVEGNVEAGNRIDLDSTTVGGNVVSDAGDVVVTDSTVGGDIKTDGTVDLDNATVTGDVYVDPGDFSCSDSTINGQDCGSYSPKDPDDY
ncbi:hypothetical protein BRD00_08150 [Halobacteriales archaeon QS_8_69_26]|nr:MAG: hypothetical protein BRD00_08150 [Halobacteriales archaeon QS_8_69_26]